MEKEIDDLSDEEFYQEFVEDSQKPLKIQTKLTQRVSEKELVSLVARQCRYPKHEVEDMIKALWQVVNENLEQGREFNFGGMFTAKLYKPLPRRLYDPRQQGFRMTDPRPKLKLVPMDLYQKYLWRGVHCPVNYFPNTTFRNQDLNAEDFTEVWKKAVRLWEIEDKKRKVRKENLNKKGVGYEINI